MIERTRIARSLTRLLRAPSFTATAVLTLGLGVGANIAIFSVAYNVLFKPLPYERPQELVGIWNAAPGLGFPEITQSAALYFTYGDQATSIESLALYDATSVSLTGRATPQEIDAIRTTHELFGVLGVKVAEGRWFNQDDDVAGAAPTAVLSHSLAVTQFGSAREAVGQSLTVSGVPREVLGVTPANFRVLDERADLFLPQRFDRANTQMGQFNYSAIGRLAPGSPVEAVGPELSLLLEPATEEFSRGLSFSMMQEAGFTSFARPLIEDVVGDVRGVLWVLLGTVGVLLLIAFANVANLFMVRADGRSREVALRTAIGASRFDIYRQFLSESLLLSLLGGGLGLAFAAGALRVLHALAPSSLPRLHEIGLNLPVLLFALALSLLSGVLFGTFPALRMRATKLMGDLKDGGRSATVGRRAHLLRHALVVAQIGLALVLLIGSGLMIRTFTKLLEVDPGFSSADQVLTFGVNVPRSLIPDAVEASQFQERLISELRTLPGVASVAGVSSLPLSGQGSSDGLWVEHHEPPEGQLPAIRRWKFVTGDFFETLKRPLVAGRPIEWADLEQRRRVAVVSENLALEYWPSAEDALGRRVKGDPETEGWWEIVGVASNVYDDGIDKDPAKAVYFPSTNPDLWGDTLFVYRGLDYAVRVEEGVDPMSVLRPAEKLVASLHPDLPVIGGETMEEIYEASFARTAFALVMLAIASAVALLLGVIGVYATLSYIISQRTQEFGVRIALGAQLAQVRTMVLKQGLSLAVVGVAVGVAGALAVTRVLEQLVYGVSATDSATFVGVSLVLVATVLLATLFAARRATSVNPLTALRGD